MAEIAPPGGGGINRRFLFIVGGLGGLLVLGLLGLGFVLFLLPAINQTFRPAATPTRIALTTPTFAPTPTRPTATNTETLESSPVNTATEEPATSTPTVLAGGETPAAPEGETPTATGTGQLPQSGLGDSMLWLGGGVVLLILLFVIRRMRTSAP